MEDEAEDKPPLAEEFSNECTRGGGRGFGRPTETKQSVNHLKIINLVLAD